MNRTIKEATVRRYFYDSHDRLREHMDLFLRAYNFAKGLKSLKGLTPYEHICKVWTEQPKRFKRNTIHHMKGLNSFAHQLRRSLACTNAIENTIGTVRTVTRNVKRWRNAEMVLRWIAAGLQEARKSFRRLKAYKQLPVLRRVRQDCMAEAKPNSNLEVKKHAA